MHLGYMFVAQTISQYLQSSNSYQSLEEVNDLIKNVIDSTNPEAK